jgi:hypothetical protein
MPSDSVAKWTISLHKTDICIHSTGSELWTLYLIS